MPENEKFSPPVNLTHRIVGAVILVTAAVILVPLILSEQQPPAELAPAGDVKRTGATTPGTGETGHGTASEYGLPEPPAPVTEPKPATPPAPKAPGSANLEKGWVVQVGVFANAGNAARLGERLRQQGHAVLLDSIGANSDRRTRLRVGPFPGREAAQQAQQKIQQHAGVAGAVMAYP